VKDRDRKQLLVYLGMIAPGLLIYLFIVAYPLIYSIWLSFSDFNPNMQNRWSLVGFLHYKTMLQDPNFWKALKNTMIVVMVSVFGQIPIAFVLAYIINRELVRFRNFFQSMVFLPQFLSTIVVGLLWKRMFSADGPVSTLMQIFSGDPSRQFDAMLHQETVMYPIGFALVWMYTGFFMIVFLANLQKIDKHLVEAAKIDGASEFQIFSRIIFPMLAGTVMVCTVLAIAGSLKGFELVFAMTTQGLQRNNAMVLPIFMYQTAFQDYRNPLRYAYGGAIANAIVVISIALITFSNWIGRKLSWNEEN